MEQSFKVHLNLARFDTPHRHVGLFCSPGVGYIAGTFGTWLSKGAAVPLCLTHPDKEIQYVLEDSEISDIVTEEEHAERMLKLSKPFSARLHVLEDTIRKECSTFSPCLVNDVISTINEEDSALVLYTSGTTSKPKGAVHTHKGLNAQVEPLCRAWQWSENDRMLHVLPLHHAHGVVFGLYAALYSAASVEFMPRFSPSKVWQRIGSTTETPVSVFMGVPTMFHLLLETIKSIEASESQRLGEAASAMRLTVSGSSACPIPTLKAWQNLTGQMLLERYGMTETGVILSNPVFGVRKPGTVGLPVAGGLEVKLGESGEVYVRGAGCFKEYWQNPDRTKEAFDSEGYFATGDTAEIDADGYYRLLGRTSIDILKVGGYKVSALHIESELLEHPSVVECAVVGIPDIVLGQAPAAVLVLSHRNAAAIDDIRSWAEERLAKYQVPRKFRVVDSLPRNAMGKVNKLELIKANDLFG